MSGSINGGSDNGSTIDDFESARLGSVIYLCVVGICGITANSLVIFVFWKYSKLRTATNLFILNLALCDLMLSVLDNSLSVASTVNGEWLFGRAGCVAYGFFHYFFICCTISTLAVISVDRFFFITRPNQTRSVQIITRKKAFGILLTIYLYTLLFTFPPCVGWSSFVEEKYFYSGCYINYGDQEDASIVYSVTASFFLFLVPLSVMIYCYARIFVAVKRSTHRTIDRSLGTANSLKRRHPLLKRTHFQTAKMIVVVIFFSMIVWVPYVVVSLIKAASGEDLIAPLASHITILVAKSCVIYNVLIYAILNRKLKAAILDVICCGRQNFGLIGGPSSGCSTPRNRISRILSETEVPSYVVDAQRNRLSALTMLQSSEQLGTQEISPPASTSKVKNGVLKSVEFRMDQRKEAVSIGNEEKDTVLTNGGIVVLENDNANQGEGFVRRKNLPKIAHQENDTEKRFPMNQSENVAHGKTSLEQAASATDRQILYSGDNMGKNPHRVTESSFSSLSAEATGGSFQRLHHLYSSRSSTHNVRTRKAVSQRNALTRLSSPSKLYKKGTRPVITQEVVGGSSERMLASTGKGRDPSWEHTREESTVKQSMISSRSQHNNHGPRKARHANRDSVKKVTSPRKSRQRAKDDPLETSPQELLEIQNYWKRMSLCLDDIDLDKVTRQLEIV